METIAKQWKRKQEEHEAEVGKSEKKRLETMMEGMDLTKRSLLIETIAKREKRERQEEQERAGIEENDMDNKSNYPDQAMSGVLVETLAQREESQEREDEGYWTQLSYTPLNEQHRVVTLKVPGKLWNSIDVSEPTQLPSVSVDETLIKRERSTNDSVKLAAPRRFNLSYIKKVYKAKGTSISVRQGFGSQNAAGGKSIITLRFSKHICDQIFLGFKSYQSSFSVGGYKTECASGRNRKRNEALE
ncbi:hypothetical protein BKA61DRAFT_671781 [Leptodontidium sp. MPI-SDFR-AT-0119]|nr:hypothetical protein BKA61DRAFT_671781 [Leptodontidium sp. MPI-SDFR-AT-0119]